MFASRQQRKKKAEEGEGVEEVAEEAEEQRVSRSGSVGAGKMQSFHLKLKALDVRNRLKRRSTSSCEVPSKLQVEEMNVKENNNRSSSSSRTATANQQEKHRQHVESPSALLKRSPSIRSLASSCSKVSHHW